ncbi:protein of unknown function (DUF1996) domain containing protein [Lactarius tabidus]
MIVTLLALGLLFVPSSHAFFRLPCAQPVLNARVDPIVSPGKPSGHMHSIMGSGAIGIDTTFDDLINSNCTTCMVKDDKSAYWVPGLYYQSSNGSFTAVPHGGMLAYYLQRGGPNETIYAFPDGLRMIAGDPYVRNYTGTPESQAISWLCIDFNGPAVPQTPGFGNTNCPDGFRAQIFFPGCWDGKNIDSPDHKSHMAYPDGIDNGICPHTHPFHLMSLFFEVWFSVAPFNQLNDPGSRFVLANGDPTGHGLHADFYNGWNKTTLQRAVDNCTADSGVIQDCPVFQNENRFNSDDEMNSCSAPNPLPNEDVIGPIPYLPGCVAITEGPAPATSADLDPKCLAANGNQTLLQNTLLQNTSSSSIPVSNSLASPLPSTTPASGNDAVLPNSSPTSPLPSTTPASGDDSVLPSSSPASPPPSTMPASGDDSVPSSSLSAVLPTQMPADPPASSTTPTPPTVTSLNPMLSNSPAPANPSSDNNDANNGNGNSSPSLSPSPSFSPASGGPSSMNPASILPTTSMTKPSSMSSHNPTHTSSSSKPKSSGSGNHNNSSHNQQGQQDDGSDDDDTCAGRTSGSNKTSRAVSRSSRRRHHARRAGHGTHMRH